MRQKSKGIILAVIMCIIFLTAAGCKSKNTVNNTTTGDAAEVTSPQETDTTAKEDTEAPAESDTEPEETEAPETEAPETEAPETEPVATEAPTEAYVGAWTLLCEEPLNPTQSGYSELDTLVNNVISQVVTPDMNNYQKVWACYLYLVDNITYSRGMDANTGAYSSSDPATTPVEVLWATDLFNAGQGCCYNYSSAFVYLMRALGYDAHLVSGSVPKYGGGTTPHCWLYVNLRGKQYTFDPDLDMNFYTRDKNNGVAEEENSKERFFCIPVEDMSYFYKAETYHTN